MDYLSALSFWGDAQGTEAELPDLLQAIMSQAQPGGTVSPLAEDGGGYSRGSQFAPSDLSSSGGLPPWMTDSRLPVGMDYGSETGLALAENSDWIGRGVGAVTGLPGMTMLANALANNYMNNHVFMSPSNAQGDVANAVDEMLYGAVPQASRGDTANRGGGVSRPMQQGPQSEPQRMNKAAMRIWGR